MVLQELCLREYLLKGGMLRYFQGNVKLFINFCLLSQELMLYFWVIL